LVDRFRTTSHGLDAFPPRGGCFHFRIRLITFFHLVQEISLRFYDNLKQTISWLDMHSALGAAILQWIEQATLAFQWLLCKEGKEDRKAIVLIEDEDRELI